MRRRLTLRTLGVSLLLVAVFVVVLALLAVSIDRQQEAGQRARHSQSVIAAANLAHQRLLAVQTTIRGFLIRGNESVLEEYRKARDALPAATLDLQSLVAHDPAQARFAAQIRSEALSYVNDYGDPVIARTRQEGVAAGREFASANEGGARANALAGLIARLTRAEQVASESLAGDADAASDRSLLVAVIGLAVCVCALGLATGYVARRIVVPVGQLAAAAERVRQGDLSVTVPERGDEIGRLGAAFNEMARSLSESRVELESQNTELEMQAIALEERQVELAEAGNEARAQRDELARTARQLADEKRRAELYSAFADRLAAVRDPAALAALALETLGDAAGADVGVLYAETWNDSARWLRAAVRGLDAGPLAEYVVAGGEGAAARAVSRREVVHVASSDASLRVHTLSGEAPVRWEVHIPLSHGERMVGVATLGGVSQASFDLQETPTLSRLAGQAALALAEAAALAQRNWFSQVNSAVLDGVREGIALIGLDHELVFANAAMEQLARRLSMPIPAAIGARGAALETAAVDRDAYFAEWEEILADSDEPTADELEVDGMVLERYTAPVDDALGARIGRLVVLRDVSREREAERLKSDLMATVSHELRTPLASVLGYAELLRTRRLDETTRDEIVGTVHREAKRLSALIDDFLDLQSIEQERMELARVPFPVRELLAESVATFSGQSAVHRLELSGAVADDVLALGDRARVAQVVANLLSNAIKYSPDGGVVRVDARVVDGFVRVSVTDEGLGIPVAEQAHVFEKFFRVARPDLRVGGTGLGLALAHQIITAHGGEIDFESVEGKGSTFWFTLPLASAV